ncbi:MAG: acetolactate synthase small subunit [Alphaproteobacteria bacterium]|nr:acetolactate synthase small subunit [Alphaproteobacteria bacterium]
MLTRQGEEFRRVFSVLVDNEPGVLARVVGLFSARGFNIETLNVAQVSEADNLSRINIVTRGTLTILAQVKAQLGRLIPVHMVLDLDDLGRHVERELALVKVLGVGDKRVEALRIADLFRARLVDSTTESFVFEMTGAPDKLDAFLDLMRPLGLSEVSRTGVAAIARGLQPI